jgi:hypothetical protein
MGIGCDIIFAAIIRHLAPYCHRNFLCPYPNAKPAEAGVEPVFHRRFAVPAV